MSTTETILTRMMKNSDFADAVFEDANKALAEYALSAEELAKFKALTKTQFDALTPEERKSFVFRSSSGNLSDWQTNYGYP